MPKHIFQDRKSGPPIFEKGDYVVHVIEAEAGFTQKGDDKIDLTLLVEQNGARIFETLTFITKLEARIDTFLKAVGLAPKKGEPLDFNESFIKDKLIGARGWAHLDLNKYTKKDGSPGESMKAVYWITNKEVPVTDDIPY